MTAGELNTKLTLLKLQQEGNSWGWIPLHDTWAQLEIKRVRNIFSSVAMSAQTVEIMCRKQNVTLQNSILWGGKQLYITAINEAEVRHYMRLSAVSIQPVTVIRNIESFGRNDLNNPVRLEPVKQIFPAWLAEKYAKNIQETPAVGLEVGYVLIVPKPVDVVEVGDIVAVAGDRFAVEAQHLLDPDKNEYEIVLRRDA